jgi:hypothetical protein
MKALGGQVLYQTDHAVGLNSIAFSLDWGSDCERER